MEVRSEREIAVIQFKEKKLKRPLILTFFPIFVDNNRFYKFTYNIQYL